MHKTTKTKLSLSRVTIRQLSSVVGGYRIKLSSYCDPTTDCSRDCQTVWPPCADTYGACSSLCQAQ